LLANFLALGREYSVRPSLLANEASFASKLAPTHH